MNELIDASLQKLIALTIEEYAAFTPATIADKLAKALVDDAFDEGGTKSIALIADRSAGRATQRRAQTQEKNSLAEDVTKFLKG